MKDNSMKILYKEFGEKPQEGQAMLSIANIFYLMGQEQEEKDKQSEKLVFDLVEKSRWYNGEKMDGCWY